MNLEQVLAAYQALPEAEQARIAELAVSDAATRRFTPSPGPQTEAWFTPADVLLYGGEAGGGKTGLLCGLALEEHHQSLLMRRNGTDMEGGGGIISELLRLYGSRDGFSGKPPPTLRTPEGRTVTFGAAANLGDEQKYMGRARDFLGIDETVQFLEEQVRFLMGWLRTTVPGQRVRAVFASNPPVKTQGDWIIGMFRPWLDVTHPKPAQPGELRWFVTVRDGAKTIDLEVDGPEAVQRDGEVLIPTSRTFIPARLTDNPFIETANYQKQLDALPEPYRSAIRDGNFMAARADDEFQVIPTAWIQAAQSRWTPEPPEHAPMSCIALDPAGGGKDQSTIAKRYDAWFSQVKAIGSHEWPAGQEIGNAQAGLIIAERRNGATVVIDMGGGYGGAVKLRLSDNGIEVFSYKGAEESIRRTVDQQFGFYNKRAEAYWRLREALDPGQDGGSPVALPPDPELVSDLTAPQFEIGPRGIKITPKEKLVAELGRSPDKGDAVVMANFAGPKLMTHGNTWRKFAGQQSGAHGPKVVLSRQAARRRR